MLVLMCIPRATVSAVSCLVVPVFICIDLLISRVLKINDKWRCSFLAAYTGGLRAQVGRLGPKVTVYYFI